MVDALGELPVFAADAREGEFVLACVAAQRALGTHWDIRSATEGSVHYRGDGGYLCRDKAISQGESRDRSRLRVPRVSQ